MKSVGLLGAAILLLPTVAGAQQAAQISEATETCLGCHELLHPGIVAGWRGSRHAQYTPVEGRAREPLTRRVSSDTIPEAWTGVVVGCAECHTLRADRHADSFDHNGAAVHLVVSPADCATCHATEARQFTGNLMAHAHSNLVDNALYQDLAQQLVGPPVWKDGELTFSPPTDAAQAQACLYCHGTRLSVTGVEQRETDLGEMRFPVIDGWPNQGTGRVNLDGSLGCCSACHTRHGFAIEVARQPYTCKQCHVGPDVPVFKVYSASKHGNIFSSQKHAWDFTAVPWAVGEDFEAPTCAACHVSLLVDPGGAVVSERTHQMNDRLAKRIFGLIYSHAHPQRPETHRIRNRDGLSLPAALDGTPAAEFLITEQEQRERRARMQRICLTCHDAGWVDGHFARYEAAHEETNAATRTCTQILQGIWSDGYATGPGAGGSPFDEAVEQIWMDVWLFHANSIRFAAAMAGGGDYAVFANGVYELAASAKELRDWYALRRRLGAVLPRE
ncbi:MAG: hydroxylamine oxidase [Candidatus Eisenbacteria bacterium]|nr:hydroxylamine oxidase [Candidatus Eisenbacteria bacterium]